MGVKKDGDRFFFVHQDKHDSNSPIIECLIDGVSAPFAIINDPEANQLARWQLITKELEFVESQLIIALDRISGCKEAVSLDRSDREGVILKSLIDSAIIGYIKCFNQTKGRRVKLEVRSLFPTKNEFTYRKLHTSLKDLRDSYIAHAGVSNSEASQMVAVLDSGRRARVNNEVVVAHSAFILPGKVLITDFLGLVRYVLSKHSCSLQEKLNAFCKKVIENPKKFNVEAVFNKRG
ncbi:hypothetical protein [Teredinibacter turnerae]|uniref:hypothetical protein n=1 Tax=Teredinibacter turnerae TaxID=2426 RepID=UPI00037EDB93|nr:hypothetical protein [Teredinibacter turnerae]